MSTLAELFQTHGLQFIEHLSGDKMIGLSAGQQQLTKAVHDCAASSLQQRMVMNSGYRAVNTAEGHLNS